MRRVEEAHLADIHHLRQLRIVLDLVLGQRDLGYGNRQRIILDPDARLLMRQTGFGIQLPIYCYLSSISTVHLAPSCLAPDRGVR